MRSTNRTGPTYKSENKKVDSLYLENSDLLVSTITTCLKINLQKQKGLFLAHGFGDSGPRRKRSMTLNF